MSEDDIRNVIYLDEIQEKEEEQEQDDRKETPFLSEGELKNRLEGYRGRIPSVILKDLHEVLKGRKLTEEQLKRILKNVEKRLKSSGEVDVGELYTKIDRLEKTLQKLLRMQLRQAIMSEGAESAEKKDRDEGEVKAEKDPESEVMGRVDRSRELEKTELQAVQIAHALKKEDSRTFLDRIPKNVGSMMFLLRWIEHLIERVGYSGLEDVLDYYVEIGWISEDVMFEILRHAKGIKLYHENSDWRPAGFMNVHDHLMSLLFIEALKTGKMNKDLLHEVERQVYRIKKGVSEINGV